MDSFDINSMCVLYSGNIGSVLRDQSYFFVFLIMVVVIITITIILLVTTLSATAQDRQIKLWSFLHICIV